jgi:hypothetical protein
MVRGLRILVLLIFLLDFAAYSQETRNPSLRKSSRNKSMRAPAVSKDKARIICPIFENSEYPYQGLGIKVGDPVALTYKFYPNKHWSFAVDAGKAASGLYSKYYRRVFHDYVPDTLQGEETINYLTHVANADWLIEGKFLYQWSLNKISPGVQIYAGLGWQWRRTGLKYTYSYVDGDPNFDLSETGTFEARRFTYGPTAILGFEYSYFSLPLSAFIEIEGFMDTFIDPGYKRFQGGVGLRYVF